jgi:hypothetical protein
MRQFAVDHLRADELGQVWIAGRCVKGSISVGIVLQLQSKSEEKFRVIEINMYNKSHSEMPYGMTGGLRCEGNVKILQNGDLLAS